MSRAGGLARLALLITPVAWALTQGLPGVSGAAEGPVFTDVTEAAGVSYVQYEGEDPQTCLVSIYCEPERMTGGAAAGDYDGDGHVDLYVTRLHAPGILFRNRGDGTFEDRTAESGLTAAHRTNGAAWADVDLDGDLDLYLTTLGGDRFYLFINQRGRFHEQGRERGAALEDADPHLGYSVTFGDYDRDGWPDIHTTEWRPVAPTGALSHARLLRNRGAFAPGYFEDRTDAAGVSLLRPGVEDVFAFASAFSDLDRDGWADLAIAADFGTSRLFWNNGDGTFTDGTAAAGVGSDENGMGSALGDFDGDGWMDWFVTSVFDPNDTCSAGGCGWGATGNRLYRNQGGRRFARRHFSDRTESMGVRDGAWGWGATWLDYDNDGDLDLAMTNGTDFPNTPIEAAFNHDPMRLWRNDGAGPMREVAVESGVTDTASGKGLLSFDYDDDGDLDLFVVNNAGTPRLYRNDGGNTNNWLRVRVANASAHLGARITMRGRGGRAVQVRELGAGAHFLAQEDATAHFGLGEGSAPVHVTIDWPGRAAPQVLAGVAPNTTVVVCGPASPAVRRPPRRGGCPER